MKKGRACVLFSGGLDSAALLAWALARHARVRPVYVRFGLLWEKAELAASRRLLAAMKAPNLLPLTVLTQPMADAYGPHWSLTGRKVPGYRSADRAVYLPGRNLMLASKAGVYCAAQGFPVMYLGVLSGNPFPDAKPAFLKALGSALSLGLGARLRVAAPFARMTKMAALRRFPHLPYRLAFSCLRPRGARPCGRCNKCAERERALRAL